MNLRAIVLDLLTATATLSAVAMVGITLHRNQVQPPAARILPESRTIADAASYAKSGHRIGPSNARVTVVEFGDFQCPACGFFYKTMQQIQANYPRDVAVVFRHFPLPYHREAYAAARAAECAARQGRFVEMYNELYKQQASLGSRSLDEFATTAKIPNLAQFDRCIAENDRLPEIDSDIEVARKLGVAATPGILIADQLYSGAPPADVIEKLVKESLAKHH